LFVAFVHAEVIQYWQTQHILWSPLPDGATVGAGEPVGVCFTFVDGLGVGAGESVGAKLASENVGRREGVGVGNTVSVGDAEFKSLGRLGLGDGAGEEISFSIRDIEGCVRVYLGILTSCWDPASSGGSLESPRSSAVDTEINMSRSAR
jgi:hypothetical protein